MTQCIESIEPLFGQKSDTLIFSTGFPKIHMSSKMSYDHKLFDPLFFACCVISTLWATKRFHKKMAQSKPTQPMFRSRRSATTSGTCQGPCPPSRSDSSCCWETPHNQRRAHPKKKVSGFESWKLFMLVCKVKMLGEKRKNNLLKIGSFPV